MWNVADEALLAGLGTGDDDATAAFVRAWRHAGAYDARRGSVATWLLTITRNLAVDAIRAGGSTPVDPEVLVAVVGAAGGPGPDDAAATGDDVARLRRALGALPEPQRRAVVLARFGGLTAQEIGEREQIPLGTAKTRIRDGLQRLRAALAEAGS